MDQKPKQKTIGLMRDNTEGDVRELEYVIRENTKGMISERMSE